MIKDVIKSHQLNQPNMSERETMKAAWKILRNKFNYSEINTQTKPRIIKQIGVST